MNELIDWNKIKSEFNSTLILGNGASIAVNNKFEYSSLLQTARDKDYLTESIENIFQLYETKDFELILRHLSYTTRINKFLNIKEDKTRKSYEALRTALIISIKEIHASYENVSPYISKMFTYLKDFKKVISLNYDLLVYWAMGAGNNELGNWFKDCFLYGEFQFDWSRFEKPVNGAEGATLVFYPHGSLFLAQNLFEADVKLERDADRKKLLDALVIKWGSGKFIPLIVCEGESSQKMNAIKRSPYLSNVYYTVLPKIGENIVIYGWSLNKNDDHILKKITDNNIRKIAVSIYCKNKDRTDIQVIIEKKTKKLKNFFPSADICFFNAQSKNCWIY